MRLTPQEIAELLGRTEYITHWRQLRAKSGEAIQTSYYNEETKSYANGAQGADAYAVWCNLAGTSLAKKIAEKYDALGHFDTGFLGTDILLEVLFEYGFGETALRLLEGREMGSYLYMKQLGATTLCESWSGAGSWNHPMFGASARHLFTGVLGVQQRKGTAGYRDLIIRPFLPENLNYISGKIVTVSGSIFVSLQREMNEVVVSLSVPAGVKVDCPIMDGYVFNRID